MTTYTLIALCVAGAFLIEGRALHLRWMGRRMDLRMDRNVATLKLMPEAVCAECGGQQIQQDNREQNILHRASPMPR